MTCWKEIIFRHKTFLMLTMTLYLTNLTNTTIVQHNFETFEKKPVKKGICQIHNYFGQIVFFIMYKKKKKGIK